MFRQSLRTLTIGSGILFFPKKASMSTRASVPTFSMRLLMPDDDAFLGIPFHVDHGHDVDTFGFFLEFLHDNLDRIGNFFIVVQ